MPFSLVLSLGPEVTLGGQSIRLPYALLHDALGGMYRVPERFVTPFVFCALAYLAARWTPVWAEWSPRLRWRSTALLCLLLLADLRVLQPVTAGEPYQQYAFYDWMGQEEADYVVVDVPVAMSSGWAAVGSNYYTQYNALHHGKRITNGHLSRVPDYYHDYFRNEAGLGWLGGFQLFREETRTALEAYVWDLPIGYLIVHQDRTDAASGQAQDLLGRLNQLPFFCPVTVEGAAVVYGTAAHPQRCQPRTPPQVAPGVYEIDFGAPEDAFYLDTGFYAREVIGGPLARWLGAGGQAQCVFRWSYPPPRAIR
ncbi:MAG: hypothetical protein HC915_13525 [Anaerolineae bacterium]|nr:hypothetical protein [Anaerolineae bacterium]